MAKNLVIEGWRRSSHSYALVNQHQLLHLAKDSRLSLSHVDIPFFRPHWVGVDSGFGPEARAVIESLPPPSPGAADVVYRISWPLRVHAAAGNPRVFVFGTSELQLLQPEECCGPSGTCVDVDREAVEIITPSQWSRVGFLASGFDERRVHVIPHGVDTSAFWHPTPEERRQVRAALQIPEDAHVFLNIGAMTWNKGIGILLAAFAVYQQRDPRAILLLKGGDQLYGNIIKSSFEEAGRLIKGGTFPQSAVRAIRYSGNNLSLPDLARLYRASDAYVAPYRAEGFNLPALEALASGILPIVTGGGATDDFCPDHLALKVGTFPRQKQDGSRFLEPNLESLLACMQHAINDTSLRDRVAVDGPRWVAERFTWEHVSRTLADRLAA